MTKIAALGFVVGLFLSQTVLAAPPQLAPCELHVWPTKNFNAVFHGANAGMGTYGAVITGTYLTPLDHIKQQVGANLTEQDQVAVVESLNLGQSGKFGGYRIIFHPAPDMSKYWNWIDPKVGSGKRDAPSDATCYAELHVLFVTLFRTALSKKIQTAFLYREFGDQPLVDSKAVDASSTGAPGFPAKDPSASDQARADLHNAFRTNVTQFLRKKKVAAR